ncbi:DUF7352 domain-containing protein [Oceanospirillum sanctuarii]|uniref:DUF7352 domain-containing protein n=1 Tax=Oceanospirillum sanctuarii TaxID=1434821 RepID=UPI00111D8E4F|nr:hypothetical protein [Oceanospirillum sanctuarii]
MKTVLKYQIDEKETTTLNLREGSELVRFEYVQADKALFAWFEEPLRADIPTTEVEFKVIRTGHPIQDEYIYLSTALDVIGPEAFHLYQSQQQSTGDKSFGGRQNKDRIDRMKLSEAA